MKWSIALLPLVACIFFLSGCWNYKELNEIDIVTGIAVDYNTNEDEHGKYHLTLEMIDTTVASKDKSAEPKYIDCYGESVFDAVRNAKKRLIKKAYLGNMQTLIISRRIAEIEGITSILEVLLRDEETRETMSVVISYEDTAAALFKTHATDTPIISAELKKTVDADSNITASSVDVMLYEAYDALYGKGKSLLLPVFRVTKNQEYEVAELHGAAIFDGDKLAGFLAPLECRYYLLLMGQLKGGALNIEMGVEEPYLVSFEIKDAQTKRSVKLEPDLLKYEVIIDFVLNLIESTPNVEFPGKGLKIKKEMEEVVSKVLESKLEEFYYSVRERFHFDIFSIGNIIYKKSRKDWAKCSDNWDEIFNKSEIKVKCTVEIPFSGVLKD